MRRYSEDYFDRYDGHGKYGWHHPGYGYNGQGGWHHPWYGYGNYGYSGSYDGNYCCKDGVCSANCFTGGYGVNSGFNNNGWYHPWYGYGGQGWHQPWYGHGGHGWHRPWYGYGGYGY